MSLKTVLINNYCDSISLQDTSKQTYFQPSYTNQEQSDLLDLFA